jgi:hypothetical protein
MLAIFSRSTAAFALLLAVVLSRSIRRSATIANNSTTRNSKTRRLGVAASPKTATNQGFEKKRKGCKVDCWVVEAMVMLVVVMDVVLRWCCW